MKVDRSAGVLHCYQFLFPCIANKLCRNTCVYLQVSSGPFVRKPGSSTRLQRAGSQRNFKRKKCIKYKNNNAPKPSGIFLSVNKLIRHTWASHVLGSPSGFVSGHTSCSSGSRGLWDLTEGQRQPCSLLCALFSWKRTQKSLEATL